MNDAINAHDISRIFMTHVKKVVIIPLIFAFIGFSIAYWFIPPSYEAKTDILVNNPFAESKEKTSASDIESTLRLIETYIFLIQSDLMSELVADDQKLNYTSKQLQEKLNVKSNANAQVIQIYIKDHNADTAADIANLYTEKLQEEIKSLMHLDNITVLSEAKEKKAETPIIPRPLIYAIISFLIGIGFICLYIAISSYFFLKVTSEKDIEQFASIPSIGSVSRIKKVYKQKQLTIPEVLQVYFSKEKRKKLSTSVLESYRNIRTRLDSETDSVESKCLLITSTKKKEGKTVTASNLGIIMAMNNRRTILIDANLHTNNSSKDDRNGLANYLSGNCSINHIIQPTLADNLHYISTGELPSLPAELLDSNKMDELITTLKKTYDRIIIDSPSLYFSDSAILSKKADYSLLIVQANKTKVSEVKQSIRTLSAVKVDFRGVIINKQRHIKSLMRGDNY